MPPPNPAPSYLMMPQMRAGMMGPLPAGGMPGLAAGAPMPVAGSPLPAPAGMGALQGAGAAASPLAFGRGNLPLPPSPGGRAPMRGQIQANRLAQILRQKYPSIGRG